MFTINSPETFDTPCADKDPDLNFKDPTWKSSSDFEPFHFNVEAMVSTVNLEIVADSVALADALPVPFSPPHEVINKVNAAPTKIIPFLIMIFFCSKIQTDILEN